MISIAVEDDALLDTESQSDLVSQQSMIKAAMQPIMEYLSNINTTVKILEKTLVLTNLQKVKYKQTNQEFQLQRLARKKRALTISTPGPVRAKPTTVTVVELPAEPTTGLQATISQLL